MEDYEKKYKEALERAKLAIKECGDNKGRISMIESIFPELKESEDERIRKTLLDSFEYQIKESHPDKEWVCGVKLKEIVSWLEKQESVGEIVSRCRTSWYNEGKIQGQIEGLTDDEKYQQGWHDALEKQGNCSAKWHKNSADNKPAINHSVLIKATHGVAEGYFAGSYWYQYRWSSNIYDSNVLAWMELSDLDEQGEQKPTEWSKEDENRFQNIIACIEDCYNEKDAQDLIRWFKSLRHQPKQVWSEEDEEMAEDLIEGCLSSEKTHHLVHTSKEIADWLKSLKDRMQGKEEL